MNRRLWAGVNIGDTKTAIVLSSAPPEILKRIEFATLLEQGPEPAIRKIKAASSRLAATGCNLNQSKTNVEIGTKRPCLHWNMKK
jgi:predicted NBD/HSP70 family sugar kinase